MQAGRGVGVVASLVLAACGAGGPSAEEPTSGHGALTRALGDAARLQALMRGSVVSGGLWFDDATCAEFSAGEVPSARLAAFARCLATQPLVPSAREDSLPDVTVLDHAAGFQLEARVIDEEDGPRLAWIGFASRADGDALVPTITPAALEALRIAGDPSGPVDPGIASQLELDLVPGAKVAFAWLRVCLDEAGAVTIRPIEATSLAAQLAFTAAAQRWQFRPFQLADQPVPACATVRMAYPADQAPPVERLPLPPPSWRGRRPPFVASPSSRLLEGRRIAGEKLIVPEPRAKLALQQRRISRLEGTFRLCVDEQGRVELVLPVRLTGLASYDAQLFDAIHRWRYQPYTIDGVAVPVCTAVTFIYTQR